MICILFNIVFSIIVFSYGVYFLQKSDENLQGAQHQMIEEFVQKWIHKDENGFSYHNHATRMEIEAGTILEHF